MTKRSEADVGSLSFKDRTLSKAAAKELFDTKSANALGGIIDTTVGRIKQAKTTKVAKATDAYFTYSSARNASSGRLAKTAAPFGRAFLVRGKPQKTA